MAVMDAQLDTSPRYMVQLTLVSEDSCMALVCAICHFTFRVDAEWLREQDGLHVSCPKCSCVGVLPRGDHL